MDELEFFLSIKFGDAINGIKAFRKAIRAEHIQLGENVNERLLHRLIIEWAQNGAPEFFEVTPANVDAVITVKFGGRKKAYKFWAHEMDPRYRDFVMTELEHKRIMDYVPSKLTSET